MTRKAISFLEWTCNRCGAKEYTHPDGQGPPRGWGDSTQQPYTGTAPPTPGVDFCPACHRGPGNDNLTDESGFRAAIRSDPHDIATQSAYADWLEERGDDRAEYLRLVMQAERIQTRLRDLRQHINSGWLGLISLCERSWILPRLNGYLEALANLNEGANHVCGYRVSEIPCKGTLDNSLAAHFDGLINISAGRDGQQVRQGGWVIETTEVADGWGHIQQLCLEYSFGQEFSPTRPARSTPPDWCVRPVIYLLQDWSAGSAVRIFEVTATSTEVFCGLHYADVLIQAGDRLLLLHLGWSD